MPSTTQTIDERVKAGAKLLDEKLPGWWEKVNLKRLDMLSCSNCVLGQAFGGFIAGIAWIGLAARNLVNHGFAFDEEYQGTPRKQKN